MAYTRSQAIAGRSSVLQYSTNPPSIPFNELAEVKNISFSGTKADLADVTNMESGNYREWLPTLLDSGELSFTGNLIANDTSEADILGFFSGQTLVEWEVVLPPSPNFPTTTGTYSFSAYVTKYERSIPHDKEASVSGSLKITGAISFVAGS